MNEFNVLLNAATNGTPSGSLFDALFARYIAPQESWRELESPLPITILAAGEDLIDYRIYGNTENGESVGERTENLLDKNAPDYENGCFYDQNNTKYINIAYAESGYIPVEAGTYSIVTTVSVTGRVLIANFFDTNKNFDSNLLNRINPPKVSTLTIPSDGYVRFNISLGGSYANAFMFIEGSTAPTSYIPYGYKLPMVVTNGTTTTTTPIYIGSDPLAEDEYVDFGEQKVYRRTENLWNPNTAEKKRILYNGTTTNDGNHALNTIPVESGLNYVFYSAEVLSYAETFYQFRDDNDEIVGSVRNSRGLQRALFTVPENATKVLMCFSRAWEDGIIRDFGVYQMDTLPSEYIPYITPTDPPVPIPALPTIQGETIIDYNPSTTPAVEPEKMYIKYKPR